MLRRYRLLRLALIGLIAVLLLAFIPTNNIHQVHAATCTWGDIICDMQQAMQQLLDNYVTPLKAWVQLQANKALYSLEYSLSRTIAGFMWSSSKTLTTSGVGIGVLNSWIATNFFQPMIQMSSDSMKPIVGVFLFLALGILGISYLLAAFIRLNVVNLRSVILWWIAGGLFFSLGANLYQSMRNLNQSLNSLFYASSLSAISSQNPFQSLAAGDAAQSNPVFSMPTPCSNFTVYLSGSTGNLNGLDIALAYQKADGFDVVNGGDKCMGGGSVADLPRKWFAANGFFDASKAPESWLGAVVCPPAPSTCDYDAAVQAAVSDMQVSVNQSFVGISREFQSTPLIWFGVTEQLVSLCLIITQGLTFISFACAILFAFFQRTEPIAWSIVDQWLSLLIQTVVIALIQGMTIALYISAASSGSPLVSMAVSIIALVLMIILLVSGVKAVWSAFNRLFEAFGQASGGVFLSPGEAGKATAGVALSAGGAAASGGLSLAAGAASSIGSLAGGVSALSSGATWAQAAGVATGGSQALDGAAFQLSRLPGLRDTGLGEAASQYMEGSATRRVGESVLGAVPGVGGALSRLGGASVGAALLTDRNLDHAEAYQDDDGRVDWRQPMLKSGASSAMSNLLTGATWESGQISSIGSGGTPIRNSDGAAFRRGDVSTEMSNPTSGFGRGETFIPTASPTDSAISLNNDGNLDETIDQDFKRDLIADKQADSPSSKSDKTISGDTGSERLTAAASKLEASGEALGRAADSLRRSVQSADTQKKMDQVEGRMNVSGSSNVASVMGKAVDNLHKQNVASGQMGATNEQTATAMAGAVGITPVERGGKQVSPIEGRVQRYQMFADQALQMGLSGSEASSVVREVKSSPDGKLSSATRDKLVHQQHDQRGESWADSVQTVRNIEHTARSLPNQVTAYGKRAMPAGSASEPVMFPLPPSNSGAVVFTPAIASNKATVFTPTSAQTNSLSGSEIVPVSTSPIPAPRSQVNASDSPRIFTASLETDNSEVVSNQQAVLSKPSAVKALNAGTSKRKE